MFSGCRLGMRIEEVGVRLYADENSIMRKKKQLPCFEVGVKMIGFHVQINGEQVDT